MTVLLQIMALISEYLYSIEKQCSGQLWKESLNSDGQQCYVKTSFPLAFKLDMALQIQCKGQGELESTKHCRSALCIFYA